MSVVFAEGMRFIAIRGRIMRLSTRSRYGTRLVLDIALYGGGSPVRITDVAERQHISYKYLEKLTIILKRAGIINSKRGPKGGHMLAKPLERITVGEVVRVLEGDYALTRCVATGMVCTRYTKCLMHGVWQEASQAMMQKLDSITFADLVARAEQGQELPEVCEIKEVNPKKEKRKPLKN